MTTNSANPAGDRAEPATIRDTVRQRYGEAARRVLAGEGDADCGPADSCCGTANSCCGAAPATGGGHDPITANLYGPDQTACLPAEAVLASLGCGNPTALAELREGDTVLDLGSGGGIDVLLSARRVGPSGKAYGLDMTDEMLALARANAAKAGATNVEFLEGEIEHIPLPDASVDVIISNCVINLSADKRRVLAEAFRVLKPGGRLAVSDVVVRGELPAPVRRSMELWVGCVAGALEEGEFKALLAETGFTGAEIEPTRIYQMEDARAFLAGTDADLEVLAREVTGRVMGAFVRATKPGAA
ncbi:MAG TPA: arsenite methyltransferase [Gemmatimonadales bacterium]|nr:arsenite methyltransferase [Gemmatimonadales bacterium]